MKSRESPSLDVGLQTWVIAGLAVVGFLVGGLVTWASLTAISGAVIAQGFVSVESKIKSVQHAEGGIVSDIFVKEGDIIKGGDLLLRLDGTEIRASLAIVIGNLNELYGQKARLEAERDNAETVLLPSPFQPAANDEGVRKIMSSQIAAFQARRANRLGQIQVLRQKILQIRAELTGLAAQLAARKRQLELAKSDLAAVRPLLASGNITRMRVMNAERDVAGLSGEVGKVESDIARGQATIEESELQILQIDKEFQEKVAKELQEIQAKAPELEEKQQALTAKLKLLEVRAPSAGMVLSLAVVTVGGVVTAAREIMQIVPQGDQLVVESRIAPNDLDQVKIGQEAFVRISAFEQRSTPGLIGHVVMVSGAQITDAQSRSTYVSVNIEIPKGELKKLRREQILRPGMPAEAFIRTTERTVMDYLTRPLWDQIGRAWRER